MSLGMSWLLLDLANQANRARNRQRRSEMRRTNYNPFEKPKKDFEKCYRLNNTLVRSLIQELSAVIPTERRSDALSVETKVLITLAFFATRSYQNVVGQSIYHYVSQPTVSRAIKEVMLFMFYEMSAIELLKLGDQGRKKSVLTEHWPNILAVFFGIGTIVTVRLQTRRPVFSGIQNYALSLAGWAAIFNFAQNRRDNYLAEKDAVLRHYIELHPEDFLTPERKKIADIFEPWIPVR